LAGLAVLGSLVIRRAGVAAGPRQFTALTEGALLGLLPQLVGLLMGLGVAMGGRDKRLQWFVWVRPVPRSAVLVGRYVVAAALAAVVCGATAFGTTFIMGIEASPPWLLPGWLAATSALGAAVYAGLFALCGAAFARPLMMGLLYCFVWEAGVSSLPSTTVQALTVKFHLLNLASAGDGLAIAEGAETLAPAGSALIMALVVLLSLLLTGYFVRRIEVS